MNDTKRRSRLGRYVNGLVLMLAVVAATVATGGPAAASPSRGPDGLTPPGWDNFELPGAGSAPLAPGLRIQRPSLGVNDDHELLSRSFDVIIIDHSDHELGTRLERRSDDGRWVTVTARSALSGEYVHRERDLAPDTRYCYRAVAHNFEGDAASQVHCAVTRAETPQPVARIQLRVETADINGAGTGEKRTAVGLAPGNSTWLDLPGGDFSRGEGRTYDLLPAGIADLADIEYLRLSGGANDPWCVDSVELLVNGRDVFRDDFDDQPDGCRWFRRSDRTTVWKVPHRTLRNHPAWGHTSPGGARLVSREDGGLDVHVTVGARELKARLKALIGHAIHGEDVRWRGDGIVLSRSSVRADYVHVKAKLEETRTPTRVGLDVDVDFDLFFAANQRAVGSDIRFTVEPRNVTSSLPAWLTWAGRIFDALPQPCGAIASTVTRDAIPGCFAAIERSIQRQIQGGVAGVGVNTSISGGEQCCTSLEIQIDQNGGVTLIGGLELAGTSVGGVEAPAGEGHEPASTASTVPASDPLSGVGAMTPATPAPRTGGSSGAPAARETKAVTRLPRIADRLASDPSGPRSRP